MYAGIALCLLLLLLNTRGFVPIPGLFTILLVLIYLQVETAVLEAILQAPLFRLMIVVALANLVMYLGFLVSNGMYMFFSDLLYTMSFSPSDESVNLFFRVASVCTALLVTIAALCHVVPLKACGIGKLFLAAIVANLASATVVLALIWIFS
jgi:hypothetical protein